MQPTRLDYCQFLLVSPTNYTLTYFADHKEGRWCMDAAEKLHNEQHSFG